MQEFGKVISVKDNEATVKIVRRSACANCHKKCDLANDHEKQEMLLTVKAEASLRKGQTVQLELAETQIISSALIVYILPVINMIIGYFVAIWLAERWGMPATEGTGIVGTVISLVISALFIRRVNHRQESETKLNPQVTSIAD